MKTSEQVKLLEDDLETLRAERYQLIDFCMMLMDEGLNGLSQEAYTRLAEWWKYNIDDGAQFWRSKDEDRADGQNI